MDNPETLATTHKTKTSKTKKHNAEQKTLKKTEGQSRESGNIGCTRHRTKTNKTKNTAQKTKKMNNTDPTIKWWVNTSPH